MKKTLFFCILLIALKVYTQTVPVNEVSLDQMMVNISKTTVTSGIIYERVAPFANLYNFNTNTNRNIADFKFFKQALLEMYLASNQSQFTSLETLNNNLNPILYNDGSVNMGILSTPFQSVNYNEINPSLGRLLYNPTTFLFNASTNTSLPLFNSSFVTVISPLKDVLRGDYISFNWTSSSIFQNTLSSAKKIKTLTVNYGTGTNYTVISNFIITSATQQITYPDTGEKLLTFTMTYSDNSTRTTYAKIKYLKVLNDPSNRIMGSDPNCGNDYVSRVHNNELVSDYPFQGYDEAYAFKGFIYYDVFYRTGNNGKILKPIIVIDGFDPGDKRQVLPCDYEPLQYIAGESRAISDVMKYGVNKDKDLIKDLQAKGYDVIIVNQPTYYIMNTPPYQKVPQGTAGSREIDGGGDYIERNGLNLVTLIKKLNTELTTNGSSEKLVIVGPSMGGQISRYALAYMEKYNIPHNTRLWVSVDSPHLGANIPLGAQAEINLLKSSNDQAKDFYDKQLGSVAAKQQLIEFHKEIVTYINFGTLTVPLLRTVDQSLLNAKTISQGFSTNSGSLFFQNFYNNQFSNGLSNSKGYPMNLRKIALVNGSLTGSKTGSDNQQTMNIRGFADVCFLYCFKIHAASMEVYTLPIFGNTSKIARFKSALTDKNIFAPNLNSRGNMDIVPGGVFDSYNQLHNSIMGQSGTEMISTVLHIDLKPKDINLESRTNTKIHSFIPTFSALGIKNPDQDWGQTLNRNLVCTGETPFDSYYGEINNTEHTSFNNNSVAWLFKELGDTISPPIPQLPSFPVNPSELSGIDKMCIGETSTYSFTDICKIPSGVIWSVSSNLQIMSFTNTSVIVNSLYDGQGVLTATFQNGQTVTTNIWVGVPQITGLFCPDDSTICSGIFCQQGLGLPSFNLTDSVVANSNGLTTAQIFDKTNWEWERVNINIVIAGDTRGDQIYIAPNFVGQTGVRVRAKNNCGWSEWSELYFEVVDCGVGLSRLSEQEKVFIVYPNPSNDIVNIDVKEGKTMLTVHSKVSAELFDIMGKSKAKINIKNNKASFNVSTLNKGIYVLQIYIDGKTESHQIGVK